MKWENWESPINIISKGLRTEFDGQVMKAIQEVGINVNKEELIRCMEYDRNQYDKGYRQGRADAIEEVVSLLCKMEEEYRIEISDKDCMQDDPFSDGILSAMFTVIQSVKQLKENRNE